MELLWKQPQLHVWLIVLLAICTTASGQLVSLIATPARQSDLMTPGYDIPQDYENGTLYEFLVTTNYVNHTVTIGVVSCDVEKDKNGDCLYDKLYVFDGPDENSTQIGDVWCCASTATTWTTTGNQAYLNFTTDDTNNLHGFKFYYESTGVTSTTPAPTTTSTTPPTTPSTAAPPAGTEDSSNNSLFIIIGCAVGGLILLLLLILVICYCLKKKDRSRDSPRDSPRDTKRVLWSRNSLWNSRSNTVVQPFQASPRHLPPGTVTQTNIFEMDLPDHGRGNQLPPLESKLQLPGPTVEVTPVGKSL